MPCVAISLKIPQSGLKWPDYVPAAPHQHSLARLNESDTMKALLKSLCLLAFTLSAATSLADNFSDGVELYADQEYSAAAESFKKAAAKGNPEAQFNLGLMYLKGEGVEQDYRQAMALFQQSAEQDNARAQLNLARMYAKGQGLVASYAKALPWFKKSAEQGYADAQYSLGVLYVTGTGAPRDYRKAYELFLQAAEQGNASAQYQLGLMYFKGKAVALNQVEALKWLILAGEYPDAISYRSYVEGKMSKQQIAEAKELAKEWQANAPEQP